MKCPNCNKWLMYTFSSDMIVIDEKYQETEHYECPTCSFRAKRDTAYKMEFIGDSWEEE